MEQRVIHLPAKCPADAELDFLLQWSRDQRRELAALEERMAARQGSQQ